MNDQPMDAWLRGLVELHPDLETRPPLDDVLVDAALENAGAAGSMLGDFYRHSNGLELGAFRIFPLESAADIRKTWDSLQRANDPSTTAALSKDEALLRRFLVFADIGNGYAMIDREDGSIWFEELGDPDISQTTLGFRGFVEGMLDGGQ